MVVSAAIDIAAPPELVRSKFLDFVSLPKYHNGFFGSIVPLAENKQQALDPGNKVRVKFGPTDGSGQSMDALILVNEPAYFKWRGSIPLLFTGDHAFKFEPSKTIPGGTHFVQEENFSGMFGFLMGDNIFGRQAGFADKTAKNWEAYNKDLKAWCEKK